MTTKKFDRDRIREEVLKKMDFNEPYTKAIGLTLNKCEEKIRQLEEENRKLKSRLEKIENEGYYDYKNGE